VASKHSRRFVGHEQPIISEPKSLLKRHHRPRKTAPRKQRLRVLAEAALKGMSHRFASLQICMQICET
jgi:hypothetical protein